MTYLPIRYLFIFEYSWRPSRRYHYRQRLGKRIRNAEPNYHTFENLIQGNNQGPEADHVSRNWGLGNLETVGGKGDATFISCSFFFPFPQSSGS